MAAGPVPEWLDTTPLPEIAHVPRYGFRLEFNHKFTEKCKPFMRPRLHQVPGFVGLGIRYAQTWLQKYREGKKLFIDNFNLVPWRPIYGAPIGGIGCGTIGRGFKGEFCRFQMVPGMYKYNVVEENQFLVVLRRNGKTVYSQVLSPRERPDNRALAGWTWGFPDTHATYHALYPRAWSVYRIPEHGVTLTCSQVSPVFPHDYADTSLPVGVFVWTVDSTSCDDLEVSIALTWKNGQGDSTADREGGVSSRYFEEVCSQDSPDVKACGVEITQTFREMPCSYVVTAKERRNVDVSCRVGFDPKNIDQANDVWADLTEDGAFDPPFDNCPATSKGEELACSVCAQRDVPAGASGTLEFCVAWNSPRIQFGARGTTYDRRYMRFFPGTPPDELGPRIAAYALHKYPQWEEKIAAWQDPVLENDKLPAWYKSALFNELYYVSDGGTVWVEAEGRDAGADDTDGRKKRAKTEVAPVVREFGRFAYLEGHEYRMYNTYDVHHYASFALVMLWPKLQLSLQYDIAAAVPLTDTNKVRYCMSGERLPVKAPDCVPHDVGDPDDEPWTRLNAYMIHPTQEWKDLNTKFILQVYRDYVVTGDVGYLGDMYAAARSVMERSLRWDTDADGIIDNGGFADQTYDAWTMTGASAYCGGMWLAALAMFCRMAEKLGKEEDRAKFQAILDKGKASFEQKLWNGHYYDYDSSQSDHHNSIMADQLAGQWFLKASLVADGAVFPRAHVVAALDTVFRFNVLPFDGGRMGAINGMRPSGAKDATSPQSEEFWTGVTYGLGASMMQEGLVDKGWQTAYGAYHVCYERYGLGFQTPEAYFDDRRYRSLGYMRPLAIWAVHYALEKFHKHLLE